MARCKQATAQAAAFESGTAPALPLFAPNISDEKSRTKRRLPKLRDGWKNSAGKTHKMYFEAMLYHNTLSRKLSRL
jgi:hypothetical protein